MSFVPQLLFRVTFVMEMPLFSPEIGGHDRMIRLIHPNSSTHLNPTPLPMYEFAHRTPDTPAGWLARLPAYKGVRRSALISDCKSSVPLKENHMALALSV